MTDHNTTEETTMTVNQQQDQHADDQLHDQDQETTSQETDPNTSDTAKLVAESKKYRQRAQHAEHSLTALQERHTNLVRSIVDHQVTVAGIKPTAFWAAGTTPDDLLTDDGNLDFTKIEQAIDHTRTHFGIPRGGAEAPGQGMGGQSPEKGDWADVFRGR